VILLLVRHLLCLTKEQVNDLFHALHREGCLRGQAAPFGATFEARSNASALAAFSAVYPQDKLHDTGIARLWDGPFFAPTEGTLDGWLLEKWYTSATSYDSIFFQNTSSSDKVSAWSSTAPCRVLETVSVAI